MAPASDRGDIVSVMPRRGLRVLSREAPTVPAPGVPLTASEARRTRWSAAQAQDPSDDRVVGGCGKTDDDRDGHECEEQGVPAEVGERETEHQEDGERSDHDECELLSVAPGGVRGLHADDVTAPSRRRLLVAADGDLP